MPKRSSKNKTEKTKDINIIASDIVKDATREIPKQSEQKNPAAVSLGRLGGLKGGKARAAKLTKKQRTEIASKAANVRWNKERKKKK